MRLPPLCRYFRGLILFLGVLLGARGADLGSLLADLGSLLGVSFGSGDKGCRQQLKPQKQQPSAAPGPCCPKGFPCLCSLYVVICVFSTKSPFKQTHPSAVPGSFWPNLLAKRGLELQRGAVFDCLFVGFLRRSRRAASDGATSVAEWARPREPTEGCQLGTCQCQDASYSPRTPSYT